MLRQNSTAIGLAQHLERTKGVGRVHYSLLESRSDHAWARRYLPNGARGVLAFELADAAAADRFIGGLKLATVGPSIGGCESLVMVPARLSHALVPTAEREKIGIGKGLVRIAFGIELRGDITDDVRQALA